MFLGLDLGTSSLKGVLIDERQKIVASADAPLFVSRPQTGYCEQNPADWITAAEHVFAALLSKAPSGMAALKAIGLSGQMHGATLIDASGKVLRPCMLWNDNRSHAEAAMLDAIPDFRAISGNIVFPGFTAPKLVWVQKNQPEIFAKTAKVLLPKDYLRLWLTGEYLSDMSDASGTSWLNVAKRTWSPPLLAASGMQIEQMPALIEGGAVSGVIRPRIAAQLGLPQGVIVAGGAGDNAASAVGLGIVKSGQSFASIGTSGVLFAANNRFSPNPDSAVHAFCHALPDTWHQMGVILAAADSLNWLAAILEKPVKGLIGELGPELCPPTKGSFLPYIGGERTPHNDVTIRGVLTGLSHGQTRQSLTRMVLEGVSFAFRDNLEALKVTGTSVDRIIAVGGGSNSELWLKMLATALNIPVDIPHDGDFGAAFGAARLGLIAATDTDPALVCMPPDIKKTIEPNAKLRPDFDEAYARYQHTYQAIKDARDD